MPELGAPGSARGVPGNGHSYRKPGSIAATRSDSANVHFGVDSRVRGGGRQSASQDLDVPGAWIVPLQK